MHSVPPAASTSPIPNAPRRALLPSERAQLIAMTLCADKTVVRWWQGLPVQGATRERLSRAATQLGIQLDAVLEPTG